MSLIIFNLFSNFKGWIDYLFFCSLEVYLARSISNIPDSSWPLASRNLFRIYLCLSFATGFDSSFSLWI